MALSSDTPDPAFILALHTAMAVDPILQDIDSDPTFKLQDGILLKDELIYIPNDDLRLQVLKQLHDNPSAGHFGIAKTVEMVSRNFWWPQMRKFIAHYVLTCDCNRSKAPRNKPHGLLQPLPVPERPWVDLSTDFIVELPPSAGYNAISVWVDRLTKMAHFIPCHTTITADGLAAVFRDNIFRLHGLPSTIVSDRGPQYISRFWDSFCKTLDIKVNLSTAYHPE